MNVSPSLINLAKNIYARIDEQLSRAEEQAAELEKKLESLDDLSENFRRLMHCSDSENRLRANRAYPIDLDFPPQTVADDEVCQKLRNIVRKQIRKKTWFGWDRPVKVNGYALQRAYDLFSDMVSRKMTESDYNHVRETPEHELVREWE